MGICPSASHYVYGCMSYPCLFWWCGSQDAEQELLLNANEAGEREGRPLPVQQFILSNTPEPPLCNMTHLRVPVCGTDPQTHTSSYPHQTTKHPAYARAHIAAYIGGLQCDVYSTGRQTRAFSAATNLPLYKVRQSFVILKCGRKAWQSAFPTLLRASHFSFHVLCTPHTSHTCPFASCALHTLIQTGRPAPAAS